MRYEQGGTNTTAINPATASSNVGLGPTLTSGRTFWLRGVAIYPNATVGPLIICDATVGSTATTPKLTIDLPSAPAGDDLKVVTIPAPGLKFTTGIVGHLDASGSIPIGQVSVMGYEHG